MYLWTQLIHAWPDSGCMYTFLTLHKAQKHHFVRTAESEKLAISSLFASAHSPLKKHGLHSNCLLTSPSCIWQNLKTVHTTVHINAELCWWWQYLSPCHPPTIHPSPDLLWSKSSSATFNTEQKTSLATKIIYSWLADQLQNKKKADPHQKKAPIICTSSHKAHKDHETIVQPSFAYLLDILPQSEDFSVNHNS